MKLTVAGLAAILRGPCLFHKCKAKQGEPCKKVYDSVSWPHGVHYRRMDKKDQLRIPREEL